MDDPTYDEVLAQAEYNGFPVKYPHWEFDMDFETYKFPELDMPHWGETLYIICGGIFDEQGEDITLFAEIIASNMVIMELIDFMKLDPVFLQELDAAGKA